MVWTCYEVDRSSDGRSSAPPKLSNERGAPKRMKDQLGLKWPFQAKITDRSAMSALIRHRTTVADLW